MAISSFFSRFSSSFLSSRLSLEVSLGDFGEAVTLASLTFLAAKVAGGDFGDFDEVAAADLAPVDGEEEGERRTEVGVEGFFVSLVSDDSCAPFSGVVIFLGSDGGDLNFIFLVDCACSSETDLFFSFSSFRSTGLLTFSTGGDFGFPASLSAAATLLVGGVFSSGVLTALETRGAFIAVVTSGEGVGVWVETSEG